jgi:hypothetical protein
MLEPSSSPSASALHRNRSPAHLAQARIPNNGNVLRLGPLHCMMPSRGPYVLCLRSFLWTSGLPKFSPEVSVPVAQALLKLDVPASSKFSPLTKFKSKTWGFRKVGLRKAEEAAASGRCGRLPTSTMLARPLRVATWQRARGGDFRAANLDQRGRHGSCIGEKMILYLIYRRHKEIAVAVANLPHHRPALIGGTVS